MTIPTNTPLPPFAELAPQEVNDLIAVEIMGYAVPPRRDDLAKRFQWGKPIYSYFVDSFHPAEPVAFDPRHSLDDCHGAEGKILFSNYYNQYSRYLADLVGIGKSEGGDSGEKIVFLATFATSKQKCEAMLRAKGLCT